MPIYEYQNTRTGKTIELSRPMRFRDDCPPNLKRVVSCTAKPRIGRGGLPDPTHAAQAVPRALNQLEQTMPTSEVVRQSGFSVKEMKRIWNIK